MAINYTLSFIYNILNSSFPQAYNFFVEFSLHWVLFSSILFIFFFSFFRLLHSNFIKKSSHFNDEQTAFWLRRSADIEQLKSLGSSVHEVQFKLLTNFLSSMIKALANDSTYFNEELRDHAMRCYTSLIYSTMLYASELICCNLVDSDVVANNLFKAGIAGEELFGYMNIILEEPESISLSDFAKVHLVPDFFLIKRLSVPHNMFSSFHWRHTHVPMEVYHFDLNLISDLPRIAANDLHQPSIESRIDLFNLLHRIMLANKAHLDEPGLPFTESYFSIRAAQLRDWHRNVDSFSDTDSSALFSSELVSFRNAYLNLLRSDFVSFDDLGYPNPGTNDFISSPKYDGFTVSSNQLRSSVSEFLKSTAFRSIYAPKSRQTINEISVIGNPPPENPDIGGGGGSSFELSDVIVGVGKIISRLL